MKIGNKVIFKSPDGPLIDYAGQEVEIVEFSFDLAKIKFSDGKFAIVAKWKLEAIPPPIKNKKFPFWVWLIRFAYRQIKVSAETPLVGIPGIRDNEHPCTHYMPRPRLKEDGEANCQTDGHYLCEECIWNKKKHNADPVK